MLSPALARHLRAGLLNEQRFAAERLAEVNFAAAEIHDERAYEATLWTIAAAGTVLAKIGLSAPPSPGAVELTNDDHPLLVYRALKVQLAAEIDRADARAIEGRPDQGVDQELEEAINALRGHLSDSAKARREASLSGSVRDTRIVPSRSPRPRS